MGGFSCCRKHRSKEDLHWFEGNPKSFRKGNFNIITSNTEIVNIPMNSIMIEDGIHIMNTANNILVRKLININKTIGEFSAASIREDGRTAILAHFSNKDKVVLTVWDLILGTFVKEIVLNLNETTVKQIVALSDNRILLRTLANNLRIIDLTDGNVRNLFGHTKTPTTVNVLSSGHLISAAKDMTVKTWDKTAYVLKRSYTMPNKVRCLLEFKDKVICGTSNGSLLELDLELGKYTYLIEGKSSLPITTLTLLRHNLLAAGSENCNIIIYDLMNKVTLFILTGHKEPITSLVTLKGDCLVSCDLGNQIIIWE
jgi:WD40 repeat protein